MRPVEESHPFLEMHGATDGQDEKGVGHQKAFVSERVKQASTYTILKDVLLNFYFETGSYGKQAGLDFEYITKRMT